MPIWGIFWGRVGGKGIPQMVCESLPVSFGKRGEVCLPFLDVDLHADCQSEGYRLGLPYLRGQDICSLATRFGFPIVYKREMVSNVLAYMFSILFLGKHELKVVNEKFYLVEFQKDIQIEAPVFNIVNMEYIHSLRTRCTEDLSNGNYDSVITKSRTLMEEIFLYVLENEKVNVKMNGDLTQYYGKIKEKYGLNQSSDIDNRIN